MALIKCPECEKEFSELSDKCPNCGRPNQVPTQNPIGVKIEVKKGVWSTGRLVIGILSILLFFVISFQSCAAGISNSLEDNGSNSGSLGFGLAVFVLIAGIIGICVRNSGSRGGAIASTIFYWLGAILTIGTGDTYPDLPIWGVISFVFGLVFLIAGIKTKKS